MTTWSDVTALLGTLPSEMISDTNCVLTLPSGRPGRSQRVFISYELMKPDLELLRISSPITMLLDVDPSATIRALGAMQIGMIAFTPTSDDDGLVCLGTVLPLSLLSDSQAAMLLLYVSILAQAADAVERQLRELDLF